MIGARKKVEGRPREVFPEKTAVVAGHRTVTLSAEHQRRGRDRGQELSQIDVGC